jgi:hypothetical protein
VRAGVFPLTLRLLTVTFDESNCGGLAIGITAFVSAADLQISGPTTATAARVSVPPGCQYVPLGRDRLRGAEGQGAYQSLSAH